MKHDKVEMQDNPGEGRHWELSPKGALWSVLDGKTLDIHWFDGTEKEISPPRSCACNGEGCGQVWRNTSAFYCRFGFR